jgi:hypothetical protein
VTRCILCDAPAEYCVKGARETAYCKECAIDAFGDVGVLVPLDSESSAEPADDEPA